MGGGVPAPAVHVSLLVGEEGEQPLHGGGLGGGGHIAHGGPVQVLYLDFPVEAQPGTDHQFKHPVPQMGQPQGAHVQQLLPAGVQMKIIHIDPRCNMKLVWKTVMPS